MSGKQHSAIGLGLAIAIYMLLVIFTTVRIYYPEAFQILLGTFISSFLVDIDSERSKASQLFTRIVTILLWAIILLIAVTKYAHIGNLNSIVNYLSTYFFSLHNFKGLIILVILITLGKMSPHRGFTHKILGTACFLVTVYFTFGLIFSIGFTLGYVAHLLADKTTSNGLRIFELRLPCQDEEGNLKIHL